MPPHSVILLFPLCYRLLILEGAPQRRRVPVYCVEAVTAQD